MTEDEMRVKFEAWANEEYHSPDLGFVGGAYAAKITKVAWDAWQAATLAAQTTPKPGWQPLTVEPNLYERVLILTDDCDENPTPALATYNGRGVGYLGGSMTRIKPVFCWARIPNQKSAPKGESECPSTGATPHQNYLQP